MSGNRSLDEFVGAEVGDSSGGEGASGEEAAEAGRVAADELGPGAADVEDAADGHGHSVDDTGDAGVDPGGATADPGDVEADHDGPDPPASTYVWSPGGGTCADCGETAPERWRDGDDLVCAGCKEW